MPKDVKDVEELDDVIDPETGEVLELTTPAQLAAMTGMSAKRMLETIREGNAASEEAFEDRERDFWKPDEPELGQPPDEIRGIYLGYVVLDRDTKNPRRVHAFGTESQKHPGKPHVIRMNGSSALNSILGNFEKGTFLLVRYLGKKGTVTGFQAKMWDVKALKVKGK